MTWLNLTREKIKLDNVASIRWPTIQRVHLVEAELSMGTMCFLAFKWAIASIPTVIFFALIYWFVLYLIQQGSTPARN